MKNIVTDPSVTGPNFSLNLGDRQDLVKNPVPFNMTGGTDESWWLLQWHTPSTDLFDPAKPIINNPEDYDSLLGNALYSWHTGNSKESSNFIVYGQPKNYTYRLSALGGNIRDVFFSSYINTQSYTFNHPIKLSVYQRIAKTSVGVSSKGAVTLGNCFTVVFNNYQSPYYNSQLPTFGMFLQIPLSDNRGEPNGFSTISKGNYSGAMFSPTGYMNNRTGSHVNDATSQYLLFKAEAGNLHHVEIDLNQAVLQMAKYMADLDLDNASIFLDMKNWVIESYYVGVESDSDGNGMSLDIAHPLLTYDESKEFSSSDSAGIVQKIDDGDYGYYTKNNKISTIPSTKNKIIFLADSYLPQKLKKITVINNGNDIIDSTNLDNSYEVTINSDNQCYIDTGNCKHTIYLNGQDKKIIMNHNGQNDIYCQSSNNNNSLTLYDGFVNIYCQEGYMYVGDSSKITSRLIVNGGKGNFSFSPSNGQGQIIINGATSSDNAGGTLFIEGGYRLQNRTITINSGLNNQTINTNGEKFKVIGSQSSQAVYYTTSIVVNRGGQLYYLSGNNKAIFENREGYLNLQLNYQSQHTISANMLNTTTTEITSQFSNTLYLTNIDQNDLILSYKDNNAYITSKKSKSQCVIYNRITVTIAQRSPNKVSVLF